MGSKIGLQCWHTGSKVHCVRLCSPPTFPRALRRHIAIKVSWFKFPVLQSDRDYNQETRERDHRYHSVQGAWEVKRCTGEKRCQAKPRDKGYWKTRRQRRVFSGNTRIQSPCVAWRRSLIPASTPSLQTQSPTNGWWISESPLAAFIFPLNSGTYRGSALRYVSAFQWTFQQKARRCQTPSGPPSTPAGNSPQVP